MSGFGHQKRRVDTDLRQRFFVFQIKIGLEDNFGIGRAVEPAIGLDLAFELPRGPAGVAERQDRALRATSDRNRLQYVDVRLTPPAISRVLSVA